MAHLLRPLVLLTRLRSTYWFLPSVMTATILALGLILIEIDRRYPDATSLLGWAYGGGADGARSLLSAIAGSTVTVVSVTFSVLVVALTVSSQHFGPRLLNNFMRDTVAQLVLGIFTGTFAYCLVVLRTVQGADGNGYSLFVPHLAVTAAVVLTLLSVGMLIYYVHHVAKSMQVSEITAGVAAEMERTIDRLYPERLGEGTEPPVHQPPALPPGAMTVAARKSGYLQEVDGDAMVELARTHDTTVWVLTRPGDFVVEGTSGVAAAHPPPEEAEAFAAALWDAFVLGTDRTSQQDVEFAIQQLVEVALRALSPGVNEPFTALTSIDRLGQGLSKLASRSIPSALRTDEDGAPRVVAKPQTFDQLLEDALEPIALYADRNPAIGERLLATLALLATVAHRADDRRAIIRVADFVRSAGARRLEDERHRALLTRRHAEVLRILDGSKPRAPELGAFT